MAGGPEASSSEQLRRLLTPELLSACVKARVPFDKHASIDFDRVSRDIFFQPLQFVDPTLKDNAWAVLLALSKIGLDNMPDLTDYLPPLSDPSYLDQWIGLRLLLDHFPRMLFRGIDERWTYAYFMEISHRLGRKWMALPVADRPDSWENCKGKMGLDYWILLRLWLGSPFVHAESRELQRVALEYHSETRAAVEKETGTTDANRARREELLADTEAFPRVYRAGPPLGKHVTPAGWAFWMTMLMDVHFPIIEHFGHYPYLNAIRGRESTDEEKEWIARVDHFGEAAAEVAERVRQDVKAGKFTPLGTDSLGQNASTNWAAINSAPISETGPDQQ